MVNIRGPKLARLYSVRLAAYCKRVQKGHDGPPGSVRPKADSNWPAQANVERSQCATRWSPRPGRPWWHGCCALASGGAVGRSSHRPPSTNGEPVGQILVGGGSPYMRCDGEAQRIGGSSS
jgi:hypothetical protein